MPENQQKTDIQPHTPHIRHYRGRFLQIRIYLNKLLRLFLYQNDWKFVPMSVLVAGIVAIVIRNTMFVTMEGTLIGSFALACVALWNGCFNSIQSICRERDIIKREHRSGMHITSYIAAHVIYQALLCLLQTILAMYVFYQMGMHIPKEGMFTSSMTVDLGISLFLATFAADMLSLLLSSLVHTTTSAMTLMPFVLIFQLVFSGAIFSLPSWGANMTKLTISGIGMKCVASQADYNSLPMVTAWNSLFKMRKEEITITVTVGQVMDLLSREDNSSVRDLRSMETETGLTVGEIIDEVNAAPEMAKMKDESITVKGTIGEVIDMIGEDVVRNEIMSRTSASSQVDAYAKTTENVSGYWLQFLIHILVYISLAIFFLEFIDKDKR